MQDHLKETASDCYCLLQGTDLPTCHPVRFSRELCCLLEAEIKDAEERLPGLVHTSNYYPPMIFQVGTNATKDNLGTIKWGQGSVLLGSFLFGPAHLGEL